MRVTCYQNLTEAILIYLRPEVPSDVEWKRYRSQYGAYIGLGAIAIVGNLFSIISIVRAKLAAKYILILSKAFADTTIGVSFLSAGWMRLNFIASGIHTAPVAPWDCMRRIHNPLFFLGDQLQMMLMLMISVDRFSAIAIPVGYRNLPKTKTIGIVGVSVLFLFCFVSVGVAFAISSALEGCVANICMPSSAVSREYEIFKEVVSILCGASCCVIYTLTIINLELKIRRRSNDTNVSNRILSRQVQLTRTMAVVVLAMFIFVVGPQLGSLLFSATGVSFGAWNAIRPHFSILLCTNSAATTLIYATMSSELRAAMVENLLCKRRQHEAEHQNTVVPLSDFSGVIVS